MTRKAERRPRAKGGVPDDHDVKASVADRGDSGPELAPAVEWVNVICRAQLHPHVKLVALILARYADPDGTNAYPGTARLAVQSGISYRTVQRAMGQLRQLGAIEAMGREGMKRHWRTRYRLTFSERLASVVPSPAAEDRAVEMVAEAERGRLRKYRARHRMTRHLSDVSSGADETSLAGVSSGDETPLIVVDETPHPQHSPAAMSPGPIPVPTPKPQPHLTELDVAAPGTGRRAHANGNAEADKEFRERLAELARQHPGTGKGNCRLCLAQLDDLAECPSRQHPATCPLAAVS